jgi:Cd2+/Zn2+-exporting ATPase
MKLLFLVLAAGGAATMWMAIFADVGMLLVVTLNGVRPLRFQPGRNTSSDAVMQTQAAT